MNPELSHYEALAKEILRKCLAEEDPEHINSWILEMTQRLSGAADETALMTWLESFEFSDAMLMEYERLANTPEDERQQLLWPWESWNNLIDPLEPGMLCTITAPDGQGKTIYAESLAEHWAKRRNKVVFVHYELNRKLMMQRRIARHAGITARKLKSGKLTAEESQKVHQVREMLTAWEGHISYLHTPGWSMEKTVAELRKLHANGECDAVVLDYIEKVGASRRQLQMFGANIYQREADNVEILKNFTESSEVSTVMVAQMRKDSKSRSMIDIDRTGMRGAGEKSDKSNLVVIIKRERVDDGYSNEVDVLVDKNTMGSTGQFKQVMQPEYFRLGDPANPMTPGGRA